MKQFQIVLMLLGAILVLLSGCTHSARSQYNTSNGVSPLSPKPDNCQIDVFKSCENPSRSYSVIGDLFVGGGDVINPRLSGCMDLGEALLEAKRLVCKAGTRSEVLGTGSSGDSIYN